ncbi:DUF742 domain-containing protein [Rhabdothermincola sediminis]|jgi:hypothetical protein|uniref:DUF742 domain-containing protein n=1 Tax=Rhabdothermincola sediminis TaxID=2751370 RepID=UPI001AA0216D|nr:DUF742 domain-containing protein [Rhabdothermincola sediminis]
MTMSGDEHDDGPGLRVRSYVLTGGRTRSNADLPLETLVKVTPQGVSAAPRLALERKKIVALCTTPISIAEVSAHLSVPLGVARVLVGDMAEEGFLTSYKPQHSMTGERPDLKLLERVLDGLQAL